MILQLLYQQFVITGDKNNWMCKLDLESEEKLTERKPQLYLNFSLPVIKLDVSELQVEAIYNMIIVDEIDSQILGWKHY